MANTKDTLPPTSLITWLTTNVGRVLVSLIVPVITFLVLWQGFLFLRDSQAPKGIIAVVAILWGVGGVGLRLFPPSAC